MVEGGPEGWQEHIATCDVAARGQPMCVDLEYNVWEGFFDEGWIANVCFLDYLTCIS